ncbi:ARS binding protein 2-domain-containing protein [Gigaspora rosea]|uniref:ARS binding protein 2-domain-containing protein n=1 Tax=Gigaspora rosea TaxID=44941 RepID=A0A397W2X7_9GLOM|nr:ARS binding protein 2-domain-containing protein [Gigaspora rosea]
MRVTTASSAPAVSSSNDPQNSTPNSTAPSVQKSPQKSSKQSSSHRPIRKTRGAPKTINVASNTPNLPDSSVDKKDSTPVSSANVSNPTVSTTPARSLQPIIPASGSSSLQANFPRRGLPQKDVNHENIAQRYLEFILYCNPSAPSDLDVSSLLRSFNSVPKSDGKTFDTWVLFQLVSKHHSGEIKTWTKLAQQLGVERTNESSPQKIQQYAVRLKKWMRSIHVDAFFDYILSKSNEYYEDPYKNPTGADAGSGDDDDSDLVLKLIRRASSKRQKRKYTRRNTGSSIDTTNNNQNDDNMDEEDELELDDNDTISQDNHRKRVKAVTYSDGSEEEEDELEDDERDAWEEVNDSMQIDDSDMKLHHSSGDTSHFRVVSSGGPATQLRWRSISVGGGPIPTQSSDITSSQQFSTPVTSTTSPPHKSITSRRKHNSDPSNLGFDSFRLSNKRGQQKLDRSQSPNANWPWPSQNNSLPNGNTGGQDNSNPGFSFSELLLPPNTVSSDPKETINLFQERLVKAVGMLEDSQRKIEMLENVVRQREDEVRKRVVRRIKDDIAAVFQRYE